MREIFNGRSRAFIHYKLLFSILIIFIFALSVFSQSTGKCFSGTIKDAGGAVIPGAEITLKNSGGKTLDKVTSGAEGEFALGCFADGEYVLSVAKQGMSRIEKTLTLKKENLLISDVVLETDVVSETVTVRIEPAFVSSTGEAATKTLTPLRDVPQSVEIINRQLLDSQSARTLQDALVNVTAVSAAQGEGRRDQFLIRGFSALGDQFVDGVRDDAPYYRDLSNIEQIEVVKGPAAALFGRGSSGGIINRTTKKPNVFERVGSAETNFGTYGLKRGMIDFGQPVVPDKLAFRLVGSYEKAGSFRQYFFQERYNIAPSVAWKPTEKTDVIFQFEYLNDERRPDRGIGSFRGRPLDVAIGTYYGFPELDIYHNKVNSQSVRLEQQLGNFWTLRNVFRRTSYDTIYYNTFASGVCLQISATACTATIPATTAADDPRLRVARSQYNENFDQKNYFNQTEIVGVIDTFGVRHTLLGGVEFGLQDKNSVFFRNGSAAPVAFDHPILTRPFNNGMASTDNNFSGRVFGVYFQDQIAFNKNWKALIGTRYDDFRQRIDDFLPADLDLERTDRQWSPRAGIVYQPNEWLSFYGSYTRSFQPSGENLSLAANNTELKPELTRNYEAGAKATFEPFRLNATVSFFRLDRSNIKTTDPANPAQLILIGEQRTDGIELTVSGSPWRNLDVFAGYALLAARILKSNTVSGGVSLQGKVAQLTPRNSGNLWLTYKLPKNFRLGFGGFVKSRTYSSTTNLVALPGYARLDASLSWQSEKHYEIAFNVKNILDRRYFETAHNDNNIMPGSPVNGSITLRYRW
jgi:catecholate siderophore receptor